MSMSRDHLPSLLLLPYPPLPPNRLSLAAAYRPSLSAAISKSKLPDRATTLIVAVACPILSGTSPRTKALPWVQAQTLLAGLYTLIAIICAEQSIPSDIGAGAGSVDTRVVLVDHDKGRRFWPDRKPLETNNTVVVDLPTFAAAYHPWNYIFHANTEAGYEILSTYLKFAEGAQKLFHQQMVVVEGGMTFNVDTPREQGSPLAMATAPPASTFPVVCLGGTFDHLHPGHKLLLTAAAILLHVPEPESPPAVFVIGISGDELLTNKKYAEYVQSWDERARTVIDFLATLLQLSPTGWKNGGGDGKPRVEVTQHPGELHAAFRDGAILVRCVNIHDPFGPTITEERMDALVLSGETRAGGPPINEKRAAKGWQPMQIFEVEVLDAEEMDGEDKGTGGENFAAKISSTVIRRQRAEAEEARNKL